MKYPTWMVELVRYGICGIAAGGTDFGVYALLVHVADMPPLAANLISRPLGGIVSFTANRLWTFRARAKSSAVHVQAGRYVVVWLIAYLLSEFFLWIDLHWLGSWPVLAKGAAEGCAALAAFALNRWWTFR